MRILAIGAHPDDIELGCAGTLAKCHNRGDTICIGILSRGDAASENMPGGDLAQTRRKEAKKSADLIGAEIMNLGFHDFSIDTTAQSMKTLAEMIRHAAPDLIITHYDQDYGSDHNNTCKLVLDASLAATVPNISTPTPSIPKIPALYMMEPLGGFGFQPEIYVNITETFPIKLQMLNCHESQIAWTTRQGGTDLREYIEVVARFRGYQAMVKMAEGFVAHKSWGHMPLGGLLP